MTPGFSHVRFISAGAGSGKTYRLTEELERVIQRSLLVLEQQGAEKFFGKPALRIDDFLRKDPKGYGVINILAAEKLMSTPRLYSTFLLWLLSELFEKLPEVGDDGTVTLIGTATSPRYIMTGRLRYCLVTHNPTSVPPASNVASG